MALADGSRLGPYEILSRLGAGGMGEVYRARDPRLGRDVAIKVLPDTFAADPERLARFEREAKLLASLQHTNVAVLHGLEEAEGRRFLVMQCIEGESLAQRLARGPLPQAEALEIAGAIAAGLEAAHESGVIHRDLKPGNVMVTPAGEVKVLDFGLAKGGAGTSSSDTGLSASPTMSYAATHAGVILGTAAYMSPEQARGKPVDRRTDIWSFGCVLYEMLSGRHAFGGETISDIVARILQTEPDWTALPEGAPGRVRDLLVRCLQKDARRRLRDIGDARLEIEDLLAGRVTASGAHLSPATTLARRRQWLVPAALALVALTALATWFAAHALAPAARQGVTRFVVESPRGQTLVSDAMAQSLSPDGTLLALIAADSSGVPRVWVRRMDALAAKVLPGTEGVSTMFWSPDSRFIAFFARDRQLSKIAIAGGDPEPICDVKTSRGGTWNRDGVILLAPFSNGAIYRVSANGGDMTAVVRPDSAHGENGLRFPYFLPDGRHFLYASLPADSSGKGRVCVGSLDGSAPRVLLRAESGAIYAEPGWLLFTRRGVLVAQRFDARALKLTGDPVSLGDPVLGSTFTGAYTASASRTGVLGFGTFDPVPARLAWLDLQGRDLGGMPSLAGTYFSPRLSPDEHRALLVGTDPSQAGYIALADLDRGVVSRESPEGASAFEPIWSPDGRSIAYVEDSRRAAIVTRSLVDGTTHDYATDDPAFKRLDDWTPDGRGIVFERLDSGTKWDIWLMPLDGSGPPRPLLHSAANEERSALSPDGRWLAYRCDESGVREIYVVPFGSQGMRYQVTNGGGTNPVWRRDGSGLVFADPRKPGTFLQADLKPGAVLSLGAPRVMRRAPEDVVGGDITRDGRRVLVLVPAEKPRPQTMTVLQNWTSALSKP